MPAAAAFGIGGAQPVPGIDGGDRRAEEDQLVLVEVPAHRLVGLVGHAAVGEPRQRLSPGKGGAFLLREDAGLAPGRDQVELFLRQAEPPRDVEMDLQAEGAVVDLRDPELHQFDDRLVETGLVGGLAHGQQGGLGGGRGLLKGLVGDAD